MNQQQLQAATLPAEPESPLDKLLSRAVDNAEDESVRRWCRALLDGGEDVREKAAG